MCCRSDLLPVPSSSAATRAATFRTYFFEHTHIYII